MWLSSRSRAGGQVKLEPSRRRGHLPAHFLGNLPQRRRDRARIQRRHRRGRSPRPLYHR